MGLDHLHGRYIEVVGKLEKEKKWRNESTRLHKHLECAIYMVMTSDSVCTFVSTIYAMYSI